MKPTAQTPSVAPQPPTATALRSSRTAGVVLAAFLAAGLLSCAWLMIQGNITVLPAKVDREQLLHGDITHRFAKQLADAPLATGAARLERAASWMLLGDLGPRVRQGCPGWLFLSDELRINRHAEEHAADKARSVIALHKQLAARGIALYVAVVPDKSRIAAPALCKLTRPASLASRVTQWVQRLSAASVNAVDLTPALQPLGERAWLRTDTHWNETGAQAAAQAIAVAVTHTGFIPTPHQTFERSPGTQAVRPGDLVHLAGLDWLPPRWQPEPEQIAPSTITAAASQSAESLDDLFGDTDLPNTAVIGTSFSRNSNFIGFLETALGAPVGNFAKDGGEFAGAARDYFVSPAFKQTPPKLIIWEIPERDLQTLPEALPVLP